MTAIW